jgi:putative inorganic carbon (hco3(-)) transporter
VVAAPPPGRRSYSRADKTAAVAAVRSSGEPISHVARKLGISDSTLRSWVSQRRQEDAARATRFSTGGITVVRTQLAGGSVARWRPAGNGTAVAEPAAILVSVLAAAGSGAALAALAANVAGQWAPVMIAGVPLALAVAAWSVVDARVGIAVALAAVPLDRLAEDVLPVPLSLLTVLAVAVGIGVGRMLSGRWPLDWHPGVWWLVALWSWGVLTLPWALDGVRTLRELAAVAAAALALLVTLGAARGAEDFRRVLGVILVVATGTFLYAILAPAEALAPHYGGAVVLGRRFAPLTQPNELGAYAVLICPLALTTALYAGRSWQRWLGVIGCAASMTALVLSLSRGAWVGFVGAMVILAIGSARVRRGLVLLVPMAVVAGALLAITPHHGTLAIITQRAASVSGPGNPHDDRPAIWHEALRQISARPLTGYGLGSFTAASASEESRARMVEPVHAHNGLLTWGAETGVLGVFLVVAFAVRSFSVARQAVRRLKADGRTDAAMITLGATAGLAAVVVHGSVDYPLRSMGVLLAVAVQAGLVFAAHAGVRPGTAR